MGIDLFTFTAQIINFLILVLLLRHFLYKRVVRAMDQREDKIKFRISEAEEKQEKADQEAESYRRKQEELEENKQDILNQAEEKAGKRRKKLLEKARREVDQAREKWREALSSQKESFISNLREKTGLQINRVVGKVLKDLADEELEDRIAAAFIRRINNLDKNRRKEIQAALKDSSGKITLVSAFGFDSGRRDDLRNAAEELFGGDLEVQFEKDDELICGVELHARDQTVAWSVESYLSELEENISRELKKGLPEKDGRQDDVKSESDDGKDRDGNNKQAASSEKESDEQ